MDVVPDGGPNVCFPNISTMLKIVEMIASGVILYCFTTGLGSVVGSAISPVIKVCANPDTYQNLHEGYGNINAGFVFSLAVPPWDEVGEDFINYCFAVRRLAKTKSEENWVHKNLSFYLQAVWANCGQLSGLLDKQEKWAFSREKKTVLIHRAAQGNCGASAEFI